MASPTENDEVNKGSMWVLDQKLDQPMDEEAGRLRNMYREKKFSSLLVLRLAFQSLGVVFGDLGTSPLYVFYNTFPKGVEDTEDVIGALSLIIYSLTLIPLLKYVFIVLRANDNGQGGTFALYSLLCRHAKIKTIPNQHRTDEDLTTYSRQTFAENSLAAKTKKWLEAHAYKKNVLLILVLLVLSAAGGIIVDHPGVNNGTEALFADLSHFPVLAVQIAFTAVVFPCLLLAYSGQAAYIMQNKGHVMDAFYHSIPGTAVVIVMLVTTFLMVPIMLLVWRSHWILIVIFIGFSLAIELTYFSAVLFKIDQGGWVPLVIAAAFLIIMYVWHYGTMKRYEFEMQSRVSMAWILGLGPSLGLVRVPGIGFVYTELASGVPHIFSHFVTNLPAIHSVVVFVCIKYLPVYTVPQEERFLVKRIGPKNFHMFRCVARYGYRDLHRKDDDFEKMLLDSLMLFVRLESMMEGCSDSDECSIYSQQQQQTERSRDFLLQDQANPATVYSSNADVSQSSYDSIVPARSPHLTSSSGHVRSSGGQSLTEGGEQEFLIRCKDAGVVHILGNTIVRARRDSGFLKKIAVDYVYAFLRRVCRENSVIFNVPHESLLNVGQIFLV
ncbi:putative potassium transporter 11 [Acorus calamus]|uniref:Potassium transporter 11 n=1 Tax=Acorus calamus TaxID=4465 RepID=A0AAV9DWL2_ACOCL|nr:putative potassium transporter 11 [Acorus calamus]